MPIVVPPPADFRFLAYVPPSGLQRGHRACWIVRTGLPKREYVPRRAELAKSQFVPFRIRSQCFVQRGIQWNRSALAGLALASTNREVPLLKVDLAPGYGLHFRITHTGIESQYERRIDMWRPGFLRTVQKASLLVWRIRLTDA